MSAFFNLALRTTGARIAVYTSATQIVYFDQHFLGGPRRDLPPLLSRRQITVTRRPRVSHIARRDVVTPTENEAISALGFSGRCNAQTFGSCHGHVDSDG